MGSKSESNTKATPVNQQLSGTSSAQSVFSESGNVDIRNTVTDFGAIKSAENTARLGINAATDSAASAMLNNSVTSAIALESGERTSARALESMTRASESANLTAALSSQAAANAAMTSAAMMAANSKDYMANAASLTNNVLQRTQDQLTGVLGAVKSNSLAMSSAGETTANATADMTQKLLIAAGIVGAVIVMRG